jgi:hypothetical protein
MKWPQKLAPKDDLIKLLMVLLALFLSLMLVDHFLLSSGQTTAGSSRSPTNLPSQGTN